MPHAAHWLSARVLLSLHAAWMSPSLSHDCMRWRWPMRSSRGDSNLLSRGDFFERKGLWNVMGLHYTVNNSTSKKFLALGSSFWRGLRNFWYVFSIFCTRQLVSKASYIM